MITPDERAAHAKKKETREPNLLTSELSLVGFLALTLPIMCHLLYRDHTAFGSYIINKLSIERRSTFITASWRLRVFSRILLIVTSFLRIYLDEY